mmetsp:Transcript_39899/g.83441  ORF Transcript_39899/g.83441 Transcript_39899/m.83441 type:complete len:114 (+) Transcript_39899:346-687(+)
MNGPQCSGKTINLQQRYFTPGGREGKYCSHTKGAIWTMIVSDSDGKERFDCRVFHVYHSSKRYNYNLANWRFRSPSMSKKCSLLQVPMRDPNSNSNTPKSNIKVDALFEGIGA